MARTPVAPTAGGALARVRSTARLGTRGTAEPLRSTVGEPGELGERSTVGKPGELGERSTVGGLGMWRIAEVRSRGGEGDRQERVETTARVGTGTLDAAHAAARCEARGREAVDGQGLAQHTLQRHPASS